MINKVVGQIYETDDYSMFRKLAGNRYTKGEKKIIQSISDVGYVRNPILVNEKMEIIDGQNRFEALKTLGYPIQYIMQAGIGLRECRALNIGQTNWGTWDYIESYAAQGNESYQRVKALIVEFRKTYRLEAILSFAVPTQICGSSFCSKAIKDGKVILSQEGYETARARLIATEELGYEAFRARRELPVRSFYAAVAYAFIHPLVDTNLLIAKMEKDPKAVPPCTRPVDMLGYFDAVYNRGKHASGKVFMSMDFQKKKYL